MISEKEMKIAQIIQKDLPLEKRPFRELGNLTGMSEKDVLEHIGNMMDRGVIRKFGAVIRHQKAGYTENAMVLWAVPEDQREAAGNILASFPEITHCYERTPPFEEKYAIFTMVHFREGEVDGVMRKLSEASGIRDFKVLTSEEEYKKSSMEYF